MRIIKPYMTMTKLEADNTGIQMLRDIEEIGRVSHRSEDSQTADSWSRFIKAVVIDHGDWSIVEHINVPVEAYVDRGITHEIVRHRIGAYTQESTRFVNYEKKMAPSFVYPIPETECEHCLGGNSPDPAVEGFGYGHEAHTMPWVHYLNRKDSSAEIPCSYQPAWLCAIATCEDEYRNLLSLKWSPQNARSVFPNALASKIIITYNLRMWRHFFLMRTSKEAHPQMRQVTIPLLAQFQQEIPILFDDIIPGSRQIDNMRLPR